MVHNKTLRLATSGRDTYNISKQIEDVVNKSGIEKGICHIFIQHTSASLILCENADPMVRTDLETFMNKLVPDGDKMFKHTAEGKDDMPAHVRTTLTQNSLSIPIKDGKCNLGIWQGVFLWEHRTSAHKRNVVVTVLGE